MTFRRMTFHVSVHMSTAQYTDLLCLCNYLSVSDQGSCSNYHDAQEGFLKFEGKRHKNSISYCYPQMAQSL